MGASSVSGSMTDAKDSIGFLVLGGPSGSKHLWSRALQTLLSELLQWERRASSVNYWAHR